MEEKYFCNECNISYKTAQGLFMHNNRSYFHKKAPDKSLSDSILNENNKRIFIPYEQTENNHNIKLQKNEPSKKPQYVDIDQLEILIQNENDNYHRSDDDDDDEEEEEEVDNDRKGWLETIDNIQAHPNSHPHHPDLDSGPIMSCIKYQLDLYSRIYGLKAIESKDIQEFKAALKSFNKRKMNMMKCYFFAKRHNISRNGGDDMLKLMRYISPSVNAKELPTSWNTVTRFIDNETAFYKCYKMTIPFPKFWEMDKWDSENSPRPQEVEIRIRDLLELIADQFINPKIQLLWKEHVHINCYQKTNEKGEKVFSDIMSSPWAHNEQKKIEKIDPKGLILPILFYWDEVTAGMNGKAHMSPVMFTLGYYDEALRKQDFSKEVIGFLDGLLNTLDESLIKHLNEVKGFCKTKCEEIVKYFKKQVFFKFWELVLDSIKAASNRGILVKILGHEEPKILFPRIAFHIGDDPAQHDVAAIKCSGNVKHGCIRCMYNSREGNEYNRNRDTLRNISVVEQIKECVKIYQKKLTGLKNTKAEEDLLDDLEDKGYHPIINPFSNAPFGENNHIYNTPTDVMHLFSCGIIKSVFLWTLTIIGEMGSHKDGKSSPYANNRGLFDRRIKGFPYVPSVPHLHWCRFQGFMYINSGKTLKEKSYATGSGGGYRSSEYVIALMQTYFAVSYTYYYLTYILTYILDR